MHILQVFNVHKLNCTFVCNNALLQISVIIDVTMRMQLDEDSAGNIWRPPSHIS